MIKITNDYPVELLYPGMRVRVIKAENGAKSAERQTGIYIGTYPNVDMSDVNISNGFVGLYNRDVIVKLEDNKYWNIGENVEFEIIDNHKRSKRSKEIIMEVRKKEDLFIEDFEISKSGRGVKVMFSDGTYKKTYASEYDKFDLRRALFIALAKKFEKYFKYKDIEDVANAISIIKKYIVIVDDAMNRYEAKRESERIIANRRAKKINYKKRKKAREREELIEIQKEAYLRAMREINK